MRGTSSPRILVLLKISSSSPSTIQMMKRLTFGKKLRDYLTIASSASPHLIISGLWAILDLAGHVLRFSLTTARIFRADLQALLMKMVIALLKSGTSFSCNLSAAPMERKNHCQNRPLIRVWASSAQRLSFKASMIIMISTCFKI